MSYLLRMLRREDRRRLTGRCTLSRGTYPNLGQTPDVPCEVRPLSTGTRGEIVQAGADLVLNQYTVRLPYDLDVRRGDVLTVTRSSDPLMAGRWLTVREATIDETLTTRIVVCEESSE